MSPADTITALITGVPPCAVAWVRVSGQDAYSVAAEVFRPWPADPEPHRAIFGRFAHGDEGFALPFAEGASYTGEPTVEFSVHGSRYSVSKLLELCQAAGARAAGPGEFTMRAFMNGRIDLSQAESVADSIEADTERAFRMATLNRGGALRKEVRLLRERVVALLARVEATIDFEEEIGPLPAPEMLVETAGLIKDLRAVNVKGRNGARLRLGLRIAIVGPVNAGKSSLLNALLGRSRAIVSDVPGTTRDTIEEEAEFDGLRVVLVDTAGLRETADPVEQMGLARAADEVEAADLLLQVFDARLGPTDDMLDESPRPRILVANKSDLAASAHGHSVSALTGQGLDELSRKIVERAPEADVSLYINPRQSAAIATAIDALEQFSSALDGHMPADLLAVLLTEAVDQLGRVSGETASADLLDEIFSHFCIGK